MKNTLHFCIYVALVVNSCQSTGTKNLPGFGISKESLKLLKQSGMIKPEYLASIKSNDCNIDILPSFKPAEYEFVYNCNDGGKVNVHKVGWYFSVLRPGAKVKTFVSKSPSLNKKLYEIMRNQPKDNDDMYISHFRSCDKAKKKCRESLGFNFTENVDSIDITCMTGKKGLKCLLSPPGKNKAVKK